jgi:hypothetical protein
METPGKNYLASIIKPIVIFIAAFAVTSLVPTQIITMERHILVITFLLLVFACITYFFRKELFQIVRSTKKREWFILIGLSLFVHAATSYFVLTYLDQPLWPFDSEGTSFLLMNNYYVWAKPFDVLIQQLLIILLVLKLDSLQMSLRNITTLFIAGFGLIHIFQILKTDVLIGLMFTGGAILSSFIYPYFILKVRNGFIYNFMIHLAIYNIAALVAWGLY